jgi:hypothetical protein
MSDNQVFKSGREHMFYRTLAEIAYRRIMKERQEKKLKESDQGKAG